MQYAIIHKNHYRFNRTCKLLWTNGCAHRIANVFRAVKVFGRILIMTWLWHSKETLPLPFSPMEILSLILLNGVLIQIKLSWHSMIVIKKFLFQKRSTLLIFLKTFKVFLTAEHTNCSKILKVNTTAVLLSVHQTCSI